MANYIVPQVLINQLISEVQLNTIKNQNVLVIGPNYELFRYDVADEKTKIYIGDYVNPTGQEGGGTVEDTSGREYSAENGNAYANEKLKVDNLAGRVVIPYPGQAPATVLDADYTKVFADEVTIKLASLGSFYFLDDEETAGLDARFRFPYALTGDRRGYATKYVCRCYLEPVDGKCVDGCGKELTPYFAISYDDEVGRVKNFPRSINAGDAIRIPYVGTDGNAHVYKSTIVEVFESVKESGIFDSVQLADTLPDNFPLDKVTIPADPDDKYSIDYEAQHFTAVEDNTIHPVYPWDPGECGSNDEPDSNDDGTDILGAVQLCAQFSEVEIARKTGVRHVWNWDTYADTEAGNDEDVFGVVVTGNFKARYSNWDASDPVTGLSPEYRVLSAKLYVQHRDLVTASAEDITSIASHALVENALGTIHPDNPLAFGVYMAALNSGDRLVYYCGVPTDDLSGYNAILDKATLTDEVYFIVPLSGDEMVVDSVKAHVEEMSTAQNKLWRVGFVSQTPPSTDTIYDLANNPLKTDFYAKFIFKDRDPYTEGSNLVQFMKDDDKDDDTVNTTVKCLKDVRVGDVVKIWLDNSDDDWDDTPHYTERYVKKIVSNSVLQLTKPVYECAGDETVEDGDTGNDTCQPDMIPNGKTGNHFKVEVYRKLTPAQLVQYVADLSSSLATRRMYNVFPSVASTDGIVFSGEFLAAAAAGLASSVLPQQPLTNVELNGIGDIPIVYQTYSRAQLNTIAAGGTFIIMQDRPGSQVYVRHQISTAYSEGNLMKAELSITKNLDSISYYFAELFAPLIGKYNITPELLDVIRSRLNGGLTALESETAAGLYGPQVLAEGTEILELRQSEVNKDHVYAKVHLNLPVPFNYFDLDLEI